MVAAPLIPAIDSEDFIKEIDLEDQQTNIWDTQVHNGLNYLDVYNFQVKIVIFVRVLHNSA